MTETSTPRTTTTPIYYATPATTAPRVSKAAFWIGWIITAIIILWMGGIGIVIMVTKPAMMSEGMAKYGYPPNSAMPIFLVELACVILYAIPRTAVLGAILLTGYLGGAVSTHVRAGEPWFMPVLFGVMVWIALFLRDRRIRELAPLRRP